MRFLDKTAIVTGASMGIGADVALQLAQRGAHVYAMARSEDKLTALSEKHPRIHPVVGDVTNPHDRNRIFGEVQNVDILVNNAGLASLGLIADQPPNEIAHMFDVNVLALIDMTQRALVSMLERNVGHICNIGSVASHISSPPMTAYCATKFAVEGFSDGLRRELATTDVKVSLIQPGPAKTAFWDRAAGGDRPDVEVGGTGIPSQWVSDAIIRAIRFDHVPGYATVSVPRALGAARILDVPGVSLAIDALSSVVRPRFGMKPPPAKQPGDVIPLKRPHDSTISVGPDNDEPQDA